MTFHEILCVVDSLRQVTFECIKFPLIYFYPEFLQMIADIKHPIFRQVWL